MHINSATIMLHVPLIHGRDAETLQLPPFRQIGETHAPSETYKYCSLSSNFIIIFFVYLQNYSTTHKKN